MHRLFADKVPELAQQDEVLGPIQERGDGNWKNQPGQPERTPEPAPYHDEPGEERSRIDSGKQQVNSQESLFGCRPFASQPSPVSGGGGFVVPSDPEMERG